MPKSSPLYWSFKDLVRFESYRLLDSGKNAAELENRDRNIALSDSTRSVERDSLFRHWLSCRQQQQPLQPDPANLLERSVGLVLFGMLVLGSLLGVSVALSTLTYDGSVPVNVSVFLAVILAPQLLLLVLLFVCWIAGRLFGGFPSAWYSLPLHWCQWFADRLIHARRRSSSNGASIGEESLHSVVESLFRQHSPLVTLQGVRLAQWFGIAFNVSVLLTALLMLMFTDRAFGWQSSLTDSAQTVSQLVQWLALPWSWLFGEGSGYPSLQEIEASRILLGGGMDGVSRSGALISWWPFLLLSVTVYGLLPRMLLLIGSYIYERQFLGSNRLRASIYNPLYERLTSPLLTTTGAQTEHHRGARPAVAMTEGAGHGFRQALVLSDTLSRYPRAVIDRWLAQHVNRDMQVFPMDSLSPAAEYQQDSKLLLLLEGWQSPIEEVLAELGQLADQRGENQSVYLALLGKPGKDSVRDLPDAMAMVWRRKIHQLARPNLLILSTVDQSDDAAETRQ